MPFSRSPAAQKRAAFRDIRFLLPGALGLTATAGYVNSVVLGFFHTPVSHMTGAVAHLGRDGAAPSGGGGQRPPRAAGQTCSQDAGPN